jgi:hypothetical protein
MTAGLPEGKVMRSMQRLIGGGLVEKGKINDPLEGFAGHAYKITEKGLKVLSTRGWSNGLNDYTS